MIISKNSVRQVFFWFCVLVTLDFVSSEGEQRIGFSLLHEDTTQGIDKMVEGNYTDPNNAIMSSRKSHATVNVNGTLYVFGGYGFFDDKFAGFLRDVLELIPSTGRFKHLFGNRSTPDVGKIYHVAHEYGMGAFPGSRTSTHIWAYSDSEFAFFGGEGFLCMTPTDHTSCFPINFWDIWVFHVKLRDWKHIYGLDGFVYPIHNDNLLLEHGMRDGACVQFSYEEMYIFGGVNFSPTGGSEGPSGALWRYSRMENNFTKIGGDPFLREYSTFGEPRVYDVDTWPGARVTTSWKVSDETFGIFGGFGQNYVKYYNEIYLYNKTCALWQFVNGNIPANYSEMFTDHRLDVSYSGVVNPGTRSQTVAWALNETHWVFLGGVLYKPDYLYEYKNDMFVYSYSSDSFTLVNLDRIEYHGEFGVCSSDNSMKERQKTTLTPLTDTKLILIGGADDDNYERNDIWIVYYNYPTCNGIPACVPTVCNSDGICVDEETCECYTVDSTYCDVYDCFGLLSTDDDACGEGKCIENNRCDCDEDLWSGRECETPLCRVKTNSSDDPGGCYAEGVCLAPDKCECPFGYSGDWCEIRDATELYLYVTIPLICAAVVVCLVCAVVVGVVIYCLYKNLQQYKEIDDIEILKEESMTHKRMSKHVHKSSKEHGRNYLAKLNVKKASFVVDHKEVKAVKLIGQGGSRSKVFLAEWNNITVAWKCFDTSTFDGDIDEDVIESFEKEVQMLASLSHSYILQFYGATLKAPRIGFLMEFCSTGDLRQFLGENPKWDLKKRVLWLEQIAKGMQYLHSKLIVHRDLKCDNVLLSTAHECKIMDFGLAKVMSNFEEEQTAYVGTSAYMAPEVVLGGEYTWSCDVFSFAIMMWEILLCNFEPYETSTTFNIEIKVSKDKNFRPRTDGKVFRDEPLLKELIIKCWEHNKDERPTFQEIIDVFSKEKKSINPEDAMDEIDDSIPTYQIDRENPTIENPRTEIDIDALPPMSPAQMGQNVTIENPKREDDMGAEIHEVDVFSKEKKSIDPSDSMAEIDDSIPTYEIDRKNLTIENPKQEIDNSNDALPPISPAQGNLTIETPRKEIDNISPAIPPMSLANPDGQLITNQIEIVSTDELEFETPPETDDQNNVVQM